MLIIKTELDGSLKHARDEQRLGWMTAGGSVSTVRSDPARPDRSLHLCSLALFTSLNLDPIYYLMPSSIITVVPTRR